MRGSCQNSRGRTVEVVRMAKEFKVKQIRSTIGQTQKQKDAMRCLGLRGIGKEVRVKDHPAQRGQILKVQHLVAVTRVN